MTLNSQDCQFRAPSISKASTFMSLDTTRNFLCFWTLWFAKCGIWLFLRIAWMYTLKRYLWNFSCRRNSLWLNNLQMRRKYENFSMKKPIELCDYYLEYLVIAVRWTPEDKLAELGCTSCVNPARRHSLLTGTAITLDAMRQHKETFLSRLRIEMLVTGNFDEKVCCHICQFSFSVILYSTRTLSRC